PPRGLGGSICVPTLPASRTLASRVTSTQHAKIARVGAPQLTSQRAYGPECGCKTFLFAHLMLGAISKWRQQQSRSLTFAEGAFIEEVFFSARFGIASRWGRLIRLLIHTVRFSGVMRMTKRRSI